MPNPLDFASCATGGASSDLSPVDPFYALRYHFGMLLGVEDFETEQAYHRGKMRLHNAWLHGAGTVWGFGVSITTAGDAQVAPGLGLDAAGHELHLDAPACLNLGAWYTAHATDAPVVTAVAQGASDYGPAGGVPSNEVFFDAHVIVRFKACLAREVPALLEPCAGAAADTAFSRVAETVELLLVPASIIGPELPGRARAVKKPAQPPEKKPPAGAKKQADSTTTASSTAPTETGPNDNYHRVRLLFGLDPANTVTVGTVTTVTTDDQQVLDALTAIQHMSAADQPPALLQAFRYFAALDEVALQPPTAADGTTSLFPGADNDALVLANLFRIHLVQDSTGAWSITDFDPTGTNPLTVDNTPRLTLLPSWTIEELLNGQGTAPVGSPATVSAARVKGIEFVDDPPNNQTFIHLTLTQPVAPGTLTGSAFSVTFREISPSSLNMGAWTAQAAQQAIAIPDPPSPGVASDGSPEVVFRVTPLLQPSALLVTPPADAPVLIRVIAIGTGPAPLLDQNNFPIAGGLDSPPGTPTQGHDYVAMVRVPSQP